MEVTADDLTKPLGLEERRRRVLPSDRVPVAPILAGALARRARRTRPPMSPSSTIRSAASRTPSSPIEIAAARPAAAAGGRKRAAADASPERRRRSAAEVESASGVSIVRPERRRRAGALIIRIPDDRRGQARARARPAPRRAHAATGSCRRSAPTARRPAQVYARPAGALPGGARPPARIAILVSGLGISQSATADAIAKLPGAVTLAFAPYGQELERTSPRARARGPRGHAPGADGALRLSRQRSRPAHADRRAASRRRTSTGCTGRWAASPAMSASSTSWAPS